VALATIGLGAASPKKSTLDPGDELECFLWRHVNEELVQ
jgi:hypothetical protein